MKRGVRKLKIFILVFAIFMSNIVPIMVKSPLVAESAKNIKLNKSKITLTIDNKNKRTYQLKVIGVYKKVKWSTGNKKIAIVNQNGKVTAKKKGKTTITAQVKGEKLKCKVVVIKNKDNNSSDDYAPSEDQTINFSPYDILYKAIMNSNLINSDGNHFITY